MESPEEFSRQLDEELRAKREGIKEQRAQQEQDAKEREHREREAMDKARDMRRAVMPFLDGVRTRISAEGQPRGEVRDDFVDRDMTAICACTAYGTRGVFTITVTSAVEPGGSTIEFSVECRYSGRDRNTGNQFDNLLNKERNVVPVHRFKQDETLDWIQKELRKCAVICVGVNEG
jgi:hypothetical protein